MFWALPFSSPKKIVVARAMLSEMGTQYEMRPLRFHEKDEIIDFIKQLCDSVSVSSICYHPYTKIADDVMLDHLKPLLLSKEIALTTIYPNSGMLSDETMSNKIIESLPENNEFKRTNGEFLRNCHPRAYLAIREIYTRFQDKVTYELDIAFFRNSLEKKFNSNYDIKYATLLKTLDFFIKSEIIKEIDVYKATNDEDRGFGDILLRFFDNTNSKNETPFHWEQQAVINIDDKIQVWAWRGVPVQQVTNEPKMQEQTAKPEEK